MHEPRVRAGLVVVSALVSCFVQRSAEARPETPGNDPAAGSVAAAREHHERGIKHYELGRLDDAIDEFQKAYGLSSAPSLLFNIAQAYRLKRNETEALRFYKQYLEAAPRGGSRADAERWVAELEPRVISRAPDSPRAEVRPVPRVPPLDNPGAAAGWPARKAAARASVAAPPPRPHVDPRPRRSRGALRFGGVVSLVGGGLLVGSGIIFGLRESQAHDTLVALNKTRGTWSANSANAYADGKRYAATATALSVIGGAAIVSGGLLCYFGWRPTRDVALAPTRGGATLSLRWGF